LVWQGNRNPVGSVPRLSHDLHVLDLDTGFWEQQRTHPLQPCGRAGHNMVIAGSSIYVLCGWTWHNDDTMYLGDTFVYSTKDRLWSPIHATGTPPVGRAHAGAAYFREQIFLFGGCNGTVAASYRCSIHTHTHIHTCIHAYIHMYVYTYIRMYMIYIRMDNRYIRMDKRYIRMIYMYRRDLMVLNLRTLNWTELTPASPPPSGRSHLGMCAYDGKLFVFGQEFFKSPLHSGFT
jgi:hypothetical protein